MKPFFTISSLLFFLFVVQSSATADSNLAGSKTTPYLPLFDENSITRDYLNKNNGLRWQNKLGDWIDLNGTSQGPIPWADADVNRDTRGPISLDVTALAKTQQGKKDQLLVLSATLPVQIWSRESNRSPVLIITFQDGSSRSFLPALDCSASASTYKNINSDILAFNASSGRAFIQFDIPKNGIKSATLELWPKKVFGAGEIHVFSFSPEVKEPEIRRGIAQGLSSFADLRSHPDVVFMDLFENNLELKPEWFKQATLRPEQIDNGYLTGEIKPQGKHKSLSAMNIRYFFAKHIKQEPTEIYFRYSLRFHENFIYATQGGKLPGQAGTYNRCGWGGRKPTKSCASWSARMSWYRPVKKGPYKSLIPVGTYLYHLDQAGRYGDHEKWQAFCAMGQWCELEQYVKLNTPGKADGILRGYHNGALVYERENIRYRDSDAVRIEDVWALVYHGGTGYPTQPIRADIDNIVISNSYIGLPENTEGTVQHTAPAPANNRTWE